jgi:hypothetical protein
MTGKLSRLLLGLSLVLPAVAARAQPLDYHLLPPVSPACVSSGYGPRVIPGLPAAGTFHPGIDIPAPLGTPVRAVAAGTVIRIERKGPGGLQMLVQHPGFVGVYSHFGRVAPYFADGGRTVVAGEELGTVGMTGVTLGPHVYFGMFVGGRTVNPAPFIGALPCGSGKELVADGREVVNEDGKIMPTRVLTHTGGVTKIEARRTYISIRRARTTMHVAER